MYINKYQKKVLDIKIKKINYFFCLISFVIFSVFLFSTKSFAQENEYFLHLNPDETDYELSGTVFSSEINNAYPGMSLPVRKIFIVNHYDRLISVYLDMDIIEPNLDWLEGSVYYEHSGRTDIIQLDSKEYKFKEKKLHLYPKEKVYVEVHYRLKGNKITNVHQNQNFLVKWNLLCEVEKNTPNQLPKTHEKPRNYKLLGIIFISIVIEIYRLKEKYIFSKKGAYNKYV